MVTTGVLITCAFASQLVPVELSDLSAKSELVVVARVANVSPVEIDSRRPTPFDQVKLTVVTVLKGQLSKDSLTIILEPRGVRNFDPSLKPGDSGIFFLREDSDKRIRPITPGAVALFENTNFVVSEKSTSEQSGADQPATAPESKLETNGKTQPEAEERSR